MEAALFNEIKSEILRRHYEDKLHYSEQGGNVDWDIKRGIQRVQGVLDTIDLAGNETEVLMHAADLLSAEYKNFASLPEVLSDKVDKYGFTCAVLKNCAERFHEKAINSTRPLQI